MWSILKQMLSAYNNKMTVNQRVVIQGGPIKVLQKPTSKQCYGQTTLNERFDLNCVIIFDSVLYRLEPCIQFLEIRYFESISFILIRKF